MANTSTGRSFTKRTLVTLSHALERTALAVAEDAPIAELRAASAHDTFVPETAHTAVMVTRRRPFPVERIQQALTWAGSS